MSEENKALVRRLVDEAINGGRLELVEDLFAPELAEPARQAFRSFRAAFPTGGRRSSTWSPKATRWRRVSAVRHFPGRVHGVAPNGRRQEVDEIFFLRVREGRFVEYWGLEDNVTRLRQLGVVS